ncbi:sugar ABC transporter permease [Spirochaetia bacterium]|nr:sugar ABC transporter permease [Spirochaetia bacterium]
MGDKNGFGKLISRQAINKRMLEIILILLILIMSVTTYGFFTLGNLFNILRNMSFQGCIAFGMTLVIISGEIDLSIGSTVALAGVITALTSGALAKAGIMPMETAVVAGILLSIIVCALFGAFNGWLLTRFKMPSFIITLAMMNVLYGIAAIISRGFPVVTLPKWYNVIGAGRIGGIIPIPALILILVFLVNFVILNYTRFGRSVYAVGGNADAARLSGINVAKVKMFVMINVQICAAIAGVMVSSQVMSGSSTFGKGWEMTAISSVIIGGASLNGGIGRVSRTFVGLIFLGVIINGMTLLNVNEYAQYVVRGLLILTAVLINTVQTQRKG